LLLPNFHLFRVSDKVSDLDVIKFLRNLKSLVKQLNGVCLISLDQDLLSAYLTSHLTFLADSVFKLTSFKDHQEMKIGEYDGTIKLVKQPRVHGLVSWLSEFDIYAVTLKGKTGMVVERIHLEPEDDRAGQDENLMQKGAGSKKSVASV
jgi:PAXNEB protein